ncbi:MAG TPA: hypothetical protein VGM37_10920 [Armatimonadota bacterium]|jgi:hypothetical protein
MLAPLSYRYFLFPLDADGEDAITLERLCRHANALIDSAQAEADETHFGPVLHWAHILKTERGPDGAWPAAVNARTGEPIGPERTTAPAQLLARLGALLDTTEFE